MLRLKWVALKWPILCKRRVKWLINYSIFVSIQLRLSQKVWVTEKTEIISDKEFRICQADAKKAMTMLNFLNSTPHRRVHVHA